MTMNHLPYINFCAKDENWNQIYFNIFHSKAAQTINTISPFSSFGNRDHEKAL